MARLGIYRIYAIFVAAYILILLFTPPNQATLDAYHLNLTSYRVLLFTVVALPAFLTWLAAFYGYSQLRTYSKLIADTREGEAFETLRHGVKWLAFYLPVVSLVTVFLGAVANSHHGFRSFAEVFTNYLTIVLSLVAFAILGNGARQLAELSNVRPSLMKTRLLTLSFIVMGVLYCYFIIRNGIDGDTSPYHLPLGWLLLTNVVPYFFAWMLGLLAVLDIDAHANKVTGILYRQALRLLSGGLLTVIVTSILIQYVNSANLQQERFEFGLVLVMRYALYGCLAAGFGLIASSAKKLQQIEKI
jgi:hypothetical protein